MIAKSHNDAVIVYVLEVNIPWLGTLFFPYLHQLPKDSRGFNTSCLTPKVHPDRED